MINLVHFDNDLKKIFSFSFNSQKTYFKKDFKHLTFIFLFSFIFTIIFFFIGAMILHKRLYTIDIDISFFEDPIFSGILYSDIFEIILSDILISSLTILCFSALLYEYFWLIYSKSFDNIKSNDLIKISDEMNSIKNLKISFKTFIGSITSFLLSSITILFSIFVLRLFFLSIHVLNGPNAAFSFISVIVIITVPFMLIGYFLFPTLIYPIILIVENKSYISGIKKVYELFSGKKVKFEFLILFTVLFFISFTFFGFLVILISFFFIILSEISLQDLIIVIIVFSGISGLYIVFYIEILSNYFGNLYGLIYINLITHIKRKE